MASLRRQKIKQGDALLIVEMQRDFCAGGALPVPLGDEVVPVLNEWIAAAEEAGIPIYASRDWHPLGHPSFAEEGGQWPRHCVQDSPGAEFHPDLRLPERTRIVTKGTRFDRDQYSAFDETGLAFALRQQGVSHLWIGGLALDVCVRASVLGALQEGFAASLIPGGSRALSEEDGARTREEIRAAGGDVVEEV